MITMKLSDDYFAFFNANSNEAELYTKNMTFLARAVCSKDNFAVVANALLIGYQSGWGQCQYEIRNRVDAATNLCVASFG